MHVMRDTKAMAIHTFSLQEEMCFFHAVLLITMLLGFHMSVLYSLRLTFIFRSFYISDMKITEYVSFHLQRGGSNVTI